MRRKRVICPMTIDKEVWNHPLGQLSARIAASIDADENLRHNQSVRYSGQTKIVATIALSSARNDNQGILGEE